ncbi:MAG: M2 family metallopeptidase [Vicinamibacterales bacterium]
MTRHRCLEPRPAMAAAALALLAVAGFACGPSPSPPSASTPPTPEAARTFIDGAEERLAALSVASARAGWVQENFITADTEALAAKASEDYIAAVTELALASRAYDDVPLDPLTRRKFHLLKLGLTMPAPNNDAERAELTRLATGLNADYGRAKYCPTPDRCLTVDEVGQEMAESRDPKRLLDLWRGWHAQATPMRPRYARFVELSNKGAREMGFADTGAMWRSNYDMAPDEFARDVDRLWTQVKPLYVALHAFVRARLSARHGPSVVPPTGPMPAHLLGNVWAQDWEYVYPLVAPASLGRGVDVTALLRAKNVQPLDMARRAEAFFVSLGFTALPTTFWERSLFTRPRDRDVVCHASAWSLDNDEDVRLKMCINVTAEDFVTLHHELGHDFYDLAYRRQPYLLQGGANDGFHEAVGDAVALSMTPAYLKRLGLLASEPPVDADIGLLLRTALDKIAFLPFGLIVDKWRWSVFDGTIAPASYNAAWWRLRREYQGVSEPLDRTEEDFDPGAKYHVPGNTPYARYFLAAVLQFQFHRALCREAGYTGPLNRCSIAGSAAAGTRLQHMLTLGASQPWPDALAALSGERQLDASAMVEYFQPLLTWLDAQNTGVPVGW